jgi:hypothetical protein
VQSTYVDQASKTIYNREAIGTYDATSGAITRLR